MAMLERPDGVRIAWKAVGPVSAPAILLCTMATAAMAVWEPILPQLTTEFRVLLHDRRGEGDSDPGAPETHSFATFRDDAIGVLDAAGAPAALLCGMAFGARVALRIALDAPERMRGLILFDATGGPPAAESERAAGRDHARALRASQGLPETTVERRWFARRDPAGRGLNQAALGGEPPWVEGVERVGKPTLIACGEQDPNLPGSRRLAEDIPGAKFVAMPMAGHGSILDRPDLVAAHLLGFARGVA